MSLSAAMFVGWLVMAAVTLMQLRRSTAAAASSTARRDLGPLLSITPSTSAEGDCLADALKAQFLVRRVGSQILVDAGPGEEPSLNVLLHALEDCLTEHHLACIRVAVNGRHYVMYARDDA
jgi:hypothetical protein